MISIDKEASIEVVKAARDVFQRFGSTRLLGYGILIIGVSTVMTTDPGDGPLRMAGLWVIAGGFAVLAISYILRPHDAKPSKEKCDKVDVSSDVAPK